PKPKPETAESGEAKTRPKKTGTVKKRAKDDKGEDDKGEDKKDDEEKKIEEEAREMFGPLLTEIWEIELSDPESFERPEGGWEVARGESLAPESLPETLPNWHSQYRFVPGSDAWKIAATVGGKPVAIERPLGKGTLVVTTDTFFASNEALWSEADPAFLLWLTGGKSRVVFDETIHGTVESGGTVLLLRRYRLHGLLVGILVFVALLAWKSASSLAPGSEEIERGLSGGGEAVSGEESVSGFVRLLRRSIPPKRLLAQCLAAYRESSPGRESRRQAEAADRLLASHETSPSTLKAADAYARIAAVLADRDAR
ncbi:MAG: hypothetical protein KDM91_11180, partial [Verrucomicrobiae bacterium]|nr:hypothetical protein [Verrucomicrobiae bacterium]